MRGYERPAEKQSTNYGNHHRIRLALAEGSTVLILAMADHGQYRVGDFHLNLAAGLEADLIRQLGPAWNGGTRKTSLRVVTDCTPTSSTTIVRATTSFSVPLSPTYVAQGFFNVPAQHSPSIGRAGEPIELFLGDATVPLIGMIDRSTNRNGSPRIRRCAALRHWLAARVSNGDDAVAVEVMSSNALRLMATPHSAAA